MKIRLTGTETPPNLHARQARATVVRDPMLARARAKSQHFAMYRDRLLYKYPNLVADLDAVARGWTLLVESYCAMFEPYLSRYFANIRLVAIVAQTGDIELHRILKGTATPLGTLATLGETEKAEIARVKWTAIELRLPPDLFLQRTLSLPAASRDFLGPIIEHRLERLTPWHPDRVLYGFRTLLESEPGGNVDVALIATSKDFVAAPVQALAEAGFVVTQVGAHGASVTEPLSVDLFRVHVKAARIDLRHMVSRIALVSFGLLTVACLGSYLWASNEIADQHEAGAKLLKARQLLKASATGTVGDRERILLDAKRPDRAIVVLIDKLANAIPSNTFLKELAITPDKVRLTGSSVDAPALVRELETTGLVNVRFTAAVTREKDQRDSFEITADRAALAAADSP